MIISEIENLSDSTLVGNNTWRELKKKKALEPNYKQSDWFVSIIDHLTLFLTFH